jgi:hypothetical protein
VNVLRHRPSARFAVIRPAGFRILSALDHATTACGIDLEITCGTDDHPEGNPHTLGEAYDVSVRGLAVDTLLILIGYLKARLGPLFTVLYETKTTPADARLAKIASLNAKATGPHLHIQRKRGTRYPPPVA